MKFNKFIFFVLVSVLMSVTVLVQKGRAINVTVPEELEATLFSPNTLTPCVACIGVAPTGEVYAGVDQYGSLGKGGGKGKIIRLIDKDHDGIHDSHTVFAVIDNPRGIVPIGDKLYVLHTEG